MLIENKQPRIFGLGFYDAHGAVATLKIVPGINEVDEATWAKVKDHPIVKFRVDEGIFHIRSGDSSTAKMTSSEAQRLVEKTVDSVLLNRWFAEDSRPSVRNAITKQLTKITTAESKS